MSVTIRPTLPADSAELLEIARGTGVFKPLELVALDEVLTDYHATNQAHGHRSVTYVDGRILGFAYFAPAAMTDRSWYLYWIAVDKQTQGQGVGQRLMEFVEEAIRDSRGRQLLIETSSLPNYDATRRFYRKQGYTIGATVPDYYADHDSMVVFVKRFEPHATLVL